MPKTKGVTVKLSPIWENDTGAFIVAGSDTCSFKLDNFKSQYVVKQEKQGFKNNYMPVEKTKFNFLRFGDMIVPLACDILYIYSIASGSSDKNVGLLIGGSMGWGLVVGSWLTYPKKIKLPELLALPVNNKENRFLYIDKINFAVNKDDYIWKHYESYNKYRKNEILFSERSDEDLNYDVRFLADTLTSFLRRINFADSTEKLFKDPMKYTKMSSEISKISVIVAGSFMRSIIQMKILITNPNVDKPLFEKDIEASSNWSVKNNDKNIAIKSIYDALENGTIEFLNDTTVKKHLTDLQAPFLKTFEKWDTIKCFLSEDKISNLTDAVNSVVTIKVKNGHGSGCVISNDSYIITNYHVIGDTASKIEVLLEDGSSYIAKVIRVNPLFDLALIKTQPLKLKPFNIKTDKEIRIGSDVYSIGTPADLGLGQTIAKGIISGKRSYGTHTLIQTDVSINKGNSGGALTNYSGDLVGIINQKLIGIGVEGIGFAIPGFTIKHRFSQRAKMSY